MSSLHPYTGTKNHVVKIPGEIAFRRNRAEHPHGITSVRSEIRSIQTDWCSVLWRDPSDISRRNMSFGPGSAELAPVAPFTFVKEELTGESPKFDVSDARGVTWVVKVGQEAQAETVSSRLIWSVGYFADEAYYLDRAEIKNLPKLSRGQEFIENRSVVRCRRNARQSWRTRR